MRRLFRLLRVFGLVTILLGILAAAPILYVETQCFGPPPAEPAKRDAILAPEHHRALVDTLLTYPEWSIVHAYEDLAIVSRREGEGAFAYRAAIAGYWRNLCALARTASSRGSVSSEMKAMLYVIGVSVSAELGLKGIYETTLGALFRPSAPPFPAEDQLAWQMGDAYAAFLQQTPWYAFPFGEYLGRLWALPWQGTAPARSIERRLALSLEWGGKALYAKAMAAAAGLSPASLTIRSVLSGMEPTADARIIEKRPDGSVIVETPRYRAFTAFLLLQIAGGHRVIEIAGQAEILVTVLVPEGWQAPQNLPPALIAVPLQASPGWQRIGFLVRLETLPGLKAALDKAGGRFEHAYDY
ncbi:hypothetical protein [Rhabdaerophilum sp. SD176]|uniref:hypothetical protein n=1 Tax=Rhabdaerophilum sp. SD176 TaxID=2983548 RepID=UPI0024E01BAF|nr:hypothetical protein [Rhabdaerophilum sp. SD176]